MYLIGLQHRPQYSIAMNSRCYRYVNTLRAARVIKAASRHCQPILALLSLLCFSMKLRRTFTKYLPVLLLIGLTAFLLKDNVHEYRERQRWASYRLLRYQEYARAGLREGPGENGTAVILHTKEEKEIAEAQIANISYNVLAGNKVALDRSVPDYRPKQCLDIIYPADLPTVSVIIIFYNEPVRSILRTVHSVVNRSPPHLLYEVLLVDDASTNAELQTPLQNVISDTWPDGVVRLLRGETRGGLIRARMLGARAAKAEVLCWLDAHIEVSPGWLEPLLARIHEDRRVLLSPSVSPISNTDLTFTAWKKPERGGFSWGLGHQWEGIPDEELKARHPQDPVRTATLIGCSLIMDKEYFFETGAFDEGMDIWGGENVELPVRVWMCGGVVEYIPCSIIGHVYRKKFPYNFPGHVFTLMKNNRRFAEVWMDNYKEIFYKHTNAHKAELGDISDRLALREKLQCHSFKWFLDNIYPSKFMPRGNIYYGGQIRNAAARLCLDTMGKPDKAPFDVHVYSCPATDNNQNQIFYLSAQHELRREYMCVMGKQDKLSTCKCNRNSGKQLWEYDKVTGALRYMNNRKCIDASGLTSGQQASLAPCDGGASQRWEMPGYTEPAEIRLF